MACANSSVDSLLECSICMNEFTDPRVLSCGHTACLKCLKQHVGKRKSPGRKFLCPYCRHECVIPDEGIDSLTKNYVVTRIKDFLKGEEQAPREHMVVENPALGNTLTNSCDHCDSDDNNTPRPDVFCLDCAGYLCPACLEKHKQNHLMQPHTVVDVKDLTLGQVENARFQKNTPLCTKHSRMVLDTYCNTCSLVLCATCSTVDHRSHSLEKLSEAAEKSRARLNTARSSSLSYRAKLLSMRNNLLEMRQQVDDGCDSARVRVDAAAEELIQAVGAQQTRLQHDITEFQQRAIADVADSTQKYDDFLDKLDNLLVISNTLNTDFSQVTRSRQVSRELEAAQNQPLMSLCWASDTVERRYDKLPFKELLGNLQGSRKALPPLCHPTSVDGSDTGVAPLRMISLRFGDAVSGLILLSGFLYVTHMSNGVIWVYSLEGEEQTAIKVPQLDSPHGLAVVDARSGKIVVSDYRTKTLHLLAVNKNHRILTHQKISLDFKPEDVNVDSHTGELLVAGHSPERLIIMSPQGQVKKTIRLQEVRSVRSIVGSLHTGGYAVTDQSRRQVIWVSSSGSVLKRYVGAAASQSLGKIFDAVQDHFSRVLICDYDNSQIHLLSPDGVLIKHMFCATQSFHKPTCVCLDEQNDVMYVAHDGLTGKVVSCFRYDPTPETVKTRATVKRRPPPTPASPLPTASTVVYKMKLQLNTS